MATAHDHLVSPAQPGEGTSARRRKNKPFLDGRSNAIQNVCHLIEHVADSHANVLILGESGTGKELVARAIHSSSSRAKEAFIPVNCAAIPSELLESELFGHEKGAFTGAISTRKGRFELAEKGTLFLDEIGDMDLHMQAKLLRVLQEKTFERVGGTQIQRADVRVVAATHRNLEQMVADGEFREDLFYRLNVFPIELPPLRRRAEDIPALIYAITEKMKTEQGARFSLTNDAVRILSNYSWPGNVRELSNLLERLSILYPDGSIDSGQLPEKLRSSNEEEGGYDQQSQVQEREHEAMVLSDVQASEYALAANFSPLPTSGFNLKSHIAELEVHYIREALESCNGVVAQAAKLLGLRRTTLVEKLRKYGIDK